MITTIPATPESAPTLGRGLTHSLDLSKEQAMADPNPRNLPASIRNRVEVVGDCWVWTGAHMPTGHGNVYLNGTWVGPHRVTYQAEYGDIPNGWVVHHLCGNPPCVRPDHLIAVTQKRHRHLHELSGAAKAHAEQETCVYGHPFDGHDGKQRTCSECRRRIGREWARKKRQDPEYRDKINERKRERRAEQRRAEGE